MTYCYYCYPPINNDNWSKLTCAFHSFQLSLCKQTGGKWKAEATLTSLAEAFGKAMKQSGVESTMIIYDNISSAKVRLCTHAFSLLSICGYLVFTDLNHIYFSV